jgi:transcriptional regulator GlxA family with amidase domain
MNNHQRHITINPKRIILFLLLPEIHLLDMAGADQVFYEVKSHGQDIDVQYCSISDIELESSNHLKIGSQKHYSSFELGVSDYLFVPGSEIRYFLSSDYKDNHELHQWLRNQYVNGATICSICTGAFALAQTGLLDGKQCTTHWKRTTELQTLFPSTCVKENVLFTDDSRVMTSAGVSSGIDLALHIVAKEFGDALSFKIARELVVYVRRAGDSAQDSIYTKYRNHVHNGVHNVQDWLVENLSSKPTLEDLAQIACMSPRTLTRLFKKETGITIGEYMLLLRKSIIKELLKNPDITRKQIAGRCGLESERQIQRILKDM